VRVIAAAAAWLAITGMARADRYDGAPSFDLPAGFSAEPAADVSADYAVKLTPAQPRKASVLGALVIAGAKKLGDADLEAEAAQWHAAHLKNRVAWGMRSSGGLPRDVVHAGNRRLVRYRDKVGSAIGANEQTLTCAVIASHLCCVIAQGTPDTRDDVDAFTLQILSSLRPKKK